MRLKRSDILWQRLKYILSDYFTTSIAFLLINIFRYRILTQIPEEFSSLSSFLLSSKILTEQLVIPILLLGIYWISGYYNHPFFKSRLQEFLSTLATASAGALLIFLGLMTNDTGGLKTTDFLIIVSSCLFLFSLTYSGRLLITSASLRYFRRNPVVLNTLLISHQINHPDEMPGSIDTNPRFKFNCVGHFYVNENFDLVHNGHVMTSEDMMEYSKRMKLDQVIIDVKSVREEELLNVLSLLYQLEIPVRIRPDTYSVVTSGIHMNDIMGSLYVNLTSSRLNDFSTNIKWLFDKLLSILVLLLLSPLLLTLALAIKLTSRGPVIYSQERIGLHRRPFRIYKFRTMTTDAEKDGPQLSSVNDERVTPLGRTLRKYRLDELPQFWNVLKGDMSIVGPRPERNFFVRQILKEAPYYCLTFEVKPGITSWGMVKFGYASTLKQMVERTQYDLLYITNLSISLDIKIIIYTIRTIIRGSGM